MTNHKIDTKLTISTLTIKDGKTGKNEYVGRIGYVVYDELGRETGFKSIKTSTNFRSERLVNLWISKYINNLSEE